MSFLCQILKGHILQEQPQLLLLPLLQSCQLAELFLGAEERTNEREKLLGWEWPLVCCRRGGKDRPLFLGAMAAKGRS